MEERRNISRVEYKVNGVIVLCDSFDKFYVEIDNVSPLGMGITAPADISDIDGKDIIIVSDTLIMYANVTRQEKQDDGRYQVGIQAKKFTPEVLSYLFEHIGSELDTEE